MSPRPRVLILGGGFAGVGAAQKLRRADAEVVLVDRHDYHTFQPLLYQLATGLLETTAVGHSLRDLLQRQDNTTVHQATVTGVDLDAREVRFDELAPMTYDFLVLALGAEVNFFGTDGAAEHAFPMYTLPHALRLKDHLLERWEAADKDPSLVDDGVLNVVIVGGGPTGVETAGAIAELYRAVFARDYPALPQEKARVILVEAGPELFSMFKPRLREYAATALAERSVEVLTGARVSSVSPTRVTLKSGDELTAHTLVWGAGLQGNRLVQTLGLELQRREPHRRRGRPRSPRPPRGVRARRRRRDHGREDRSGPAPARLGGAPMRGARRRGDRPPDRRQGDQSLPVPRQGHDGDDRARRRGRADARRAHDDRQAGADGGLGNGAPGAAADERGPREGGRRLGRRHVHSPARRPDHRGRRVAARPSGRTLVVEDPSTGEALCCVSDADAADALDALAAAHAAKAAWAAATARDRARVLRRAADELERRSEMLAMLITLEMGKPLAESADEVARQRREQAEGMAARIQTLVKGGK